MSTSRLSILRFTIRELISFMVSLAFIMAWWVERQECVELQSELSALREQHQFVMKSLKENGIIAIDTDGRLIEGPASP